MQVLAVLCRFTGCRLRRPVTSAQSSVKKTMDSDSPKLMTSEERSDLTKWFRTQTDGVPQTTAQVVGSLATTAQGSDSDDDLGFGSDDLGGGLDVQKLKATLQSMDGLVGVMQGGVEQGDLPREAAQPET